MGTDILCSTIGPAVPLCRFHVRLAHPLQDGDDRLMQHNWPRRAIVSISCSARPSPSGWRRPSYAARSASQRHRVSFTFGSPHSLQDGEERLMQCDRPLSAIVPGFTVRLAHSLQDGDDRLMRHDRLLSAIVSLSRSDRPIPFQGGDERLLCSTISAPAPSCLAHVRVAHPFQDGDERLICSTISAPAPSCLAHGSARPSLPGWRRTSLIQHDQRP
ncbi:unnamed protein product, partial [Cuscuta epithymum]